MDSNSVIEHLGCLQRANTRLQKEVDLIKRHIAASESSKKSEISREIDLETQCRLRIILFARRNAVSALKTGHAELSRAPSMLCSGNTVKQVLLRTKASDCTLADFKLFARSFSSSTSFRCQVVPSAFYASISDAAYASPFIYCSSLTSINARHWNSARVPVKMDCTATEQILHVDCVRCKYSAWKPYAKAATQPLVERYYLVVAFQGRPASSLFT